MKPQKLVTFPVLVCTLALNAEDSHRGAKRPLPTGWGVTTVERLEVLSKPTERSRRLAKLGRGSILEIYEVKQSHGRTWTRVRATDPAKLTPEMGWIDSSQAKALPLSEYPRDGELLRLLGGPYLDDSAAANTSIARYLVRRAGDGPLLVCFLGSPVSPASRLQVFAPTKGGLTLGPYLEVPFVDMESGIRHMEVRDLFGDGNECLITREAFAGGPRNQGVNVVIRTISAQGFTIIWKAPVEIENLGSFPPKIEILSPPERNIGAPGTVSKGDVEFRAHGKGSEPVWKGKVEFYVVGRDEPLQSVAVEKVCAWDGSRFASLQ